MSGLINKVKDALSSDKDKHNDPRSDNYGPHSSNAANVADPRVDSDLSSGRQGHGHGNIGTTGGAYGAPGGGYGDNTAGGYGTGNTVGGYGDNTTGGYGAGNTAGYGGSTTAGPHSSNLANKVDPRVDSDLDGSRRVGGGNYGSGTTTGGYGSGHTSGYDATTTGGGYGSSTGAGYGSGSTNAGPHGSNLANKLDPRVDSDMDNRNDPTSRVGGYGTQDNYGASGANPTPSDGNAGYGGNTGYGDRTGTAGYGAGAGNTGYGNTGVGGNQYDSSATPGSGNAPGTAGPHNSNLLNKLDPRVDSDMDGSKTYGGNQTYR